MLQPYSKQEITQQILLYLHLVVEICARGASQRFLGWDITIPLYGIRKEVSVLFGLIVEVQAHINQDLLLVFIQHLGHKFFSTLHYVYPSVTVGMCFMFNMEF